MKKRILFLLCITQILFTQSIFSQPERGVKNVRTEQKNALNDNSIGRLTNPFIDANDMPESFNDF